MQSTKDQKEFMFNKLIRCIYNPEMIVEREKYNVHLEHITTHLHN